MAEVVPTEVAVGDKVRIHFHPPGSMRSFSEGVVRRVDMTTPQGRFFVVEVTHEVILDREHHIEPGFQDYVRYECRNDFPGRLEVLSDSPKEAEERLVVNLEPHQRCEIEPPVEAEPTPDLYQVEVEPQPVRKQAGLMATLFGRNR